MCYYVCCYIHYPEDILGPNRLVVVEEDSLGDILPGQDTTVAGGDSPVPEQGALHHILPGWGIPGEGMELEAVVEGILVVVGSHHQ